MAEPDKSARVVVMMTEVERGELEALASRRFGTLSEAMRAALRLAVTVYASPAAMLAPDVDAALAAYVDTRR